MIGVCELMIKLHKKNICMTDLKPANTLYDKNSKTTKFVDLAGAVRNGNLQSCNIKHVKELTPKYADPELSQAFYNEDCIKKEFDLKKCIA